MCYKTAYAPCSSKYKSKHAAKKWWRQKFAHWGYPPVHVSELDGHYDILLYAAGYAKDDFQISIKDNLLVISVDQTPSEATNDAANYSQGFTPQNFERWFELNKKIDKESITAAYTDGVLKVTLPKREGFESKRHNIEVS